MKQQPKISELNQAIEVKKLETVKNTDGTTTKSYLTRFATSFANIKAISSNQGYKEGVSEKDTYYLLTYAYHPTRFIAITDQVHWGGKLLKPVGDCSTDDFGEKKYFSQKLKHTSG